MYTYPNEAYYYSTLWFTCGMLEVDPALASEPELLLGVLSRLLFAQRLCKVATAGDTAEEAVVDAAATLAVWLGVPPALLPPPPPPVPLDEATEMDIISSGRFLQSSRRALISAAVFVVSNYYLLWRI